MNRLYDVFFQLYCVKFAFNIQRLFKYMKYCRCENECNKQSCIYDEHNVLVLVFFIAVFTDWEE